LDLISSIKISLQLCFVFFFHNAHTCLARSKFLTKVSPTKRGKVREDSVYTLTGEASALILPQETASSGRAPASDPSNSFPVLIKTE
jgi:hypothetical protein